MDFFDTILGFLQSLFGPLIALLSNLFDGGLGGIFGG